MKTQEEREFTESKIILSDPVYKGQVISKANCQAEDSPKKRTNEFVFTSMRRVLVRFFEESSARKKTFRDYLNFNRGEIKATGLISN